MTSNASSENDCDDARIQGRNFDFGCLAPALVIILVLSSLKRRTKFKLEYCDGRPGLLIPINFLGGFSNRWTIAVTFGATGSSILSLALLGKSGVSVIRSESPWIYILDVLLAVVVYGILFYPFFACLTTEYKLVGSIMGFLYCALRLSFQLATQIRCYVVYKEIGSVALTFIFSNLPTTICLIFIITRFAFLVVRWVRQKWSPSPAKSTGNDSYSSSLADDSDIVHVKLTLAQKPHLYPLKDKWYWKGLYFFYMPRADFKFSTQLISTVLLVVIAIFEVLLLVFYVGELVTSVCSSGFCDLKPVRIFKGCLYGAGIVSALISLITVLHFIKCHRDHVLQLYHGRRDLMQNVCLSPASFVGRSLSFTGYQVAYAVWGFIVFALFCFLLLFIPAMLFVYKDFFLFKWILDWISSVARGLVPSLVLSFMLWLLQRIFLSRFVFRDRDYPNITVTIDNRRLFSILSYVFVFVNVLVGLFSCLLRILKGMFLGLFFLSRIDRTCLMQGFQRWDKGFVAYLGFLHVLVAHRHPAMLVFCQLLIDSNKVQASDEKQPSNFSTQPNGAKEAKQTAAYLREVRHPRLSQKAVNRWLLAVTLLRNPSLVQYRHQSFFTPIELREADTASITVLVQ